MEALREHSLKVKRHSQELKNTDLGTAEELESVEMWYGIVASPGTEALDRQMTGN